MKQNLIITGILTIITLFIDPVQAQKKSYSAQIDSILQTTQPRSFNGVVVVSQNGKTLYSKAYGYSDFNKKKPLDISDRFSTMSLAKQITATLILLEVEKGTIDLHTPIRKYLPDLKYSWADTVTVHHLLNNTSGLHSESIDQPLKFIPGTTFSYSNIGFSIAAKVLEAQSGKSYRQLVTELFSKCGMTQSAYPTKKNRSMLSKGHTIKENGDAVLNKSISFQPTLFPGSHLMVTAGDLALWNECLHNGKLLQPATYDLMVNYSTTAVHPLFSKEPVGYGYGLRINEKNGFYEIGHTGFHSDEGFTAVNLYYPETNTSVVVLENQANENFDIAYHFEQEVRKIVLNSELVKTVSNHGINSLKQQISSIIAGKKATIGIAVLGPDSSSIDFDGDSFFPMLSTFKFPVALTVLNKVEKGELSMNQKIFIKKEELLENTWSPFQKKFPEGNIAITIEEALTWVTSYSDNNLTDILLRLIGGTGQVAQFIDSDQFIIKNNEEDMHQNWDAQLVNKITPKESIRLLQQFDSEKMLNQEHTQWLYNAMVNSNTGLQRLRGKLPQEVIVAHRTGTSFTNDAGLTGAINNFGIIELPDKQKIYIAVFVHNTTEAFSKGEEIIADIAKAVYDYYLKK